MLFYERHYLLIFIPRDFMTNMAKLKCSDYGFECDFVAEGEIEQVIEEFAKHTDDVHGIDYSKEALMQFILRKK
jgi:predicted small metal-binding protein